LEAHDRAACELIAQALRAGEEIRLRVTGTSMIPAIWPGDVLKVSPLTKTSIAEGRIVLFIRDGRLFAHRVVARCGPQLITRGDAVNDCDPPVSAAELLGVVTGIIRLRGTVAKPLQSVGPAGACPESARWVPVITPSVGQRLVAFAVRHSRLAYRVVLKWPQKRSEGRGARSEE